LAQQNKHLTHLEDRIILDGKKGGEDAIALLKEMGKFLTGKQGPNVALTTKWDGAPAVICGIDPKDGRFFVGTKSVFAQDPKICKTESDIQKFYNGALAQKLSAALRYLPQSVNRGILQGDLMFTDDKKRENIDGKDFITFRPNTITYAADPKSQLGRDINQARIGIVFHTKYTGDSLADLTASFNVRDSDFTTGGNVWAEKAEFKDISGVASMSMSEKNKYDAFIRMAEGSLKKANNMLQEIQSGQKTLQFDTEFLKFFNNYVKAGRPIPSVKQAYADYMKHIGDEFDKATGKLKTAAAVNSKNTKWATQLFFIIKNEEQFKMVIAAYMNLQAAKNILVEKLKRVSTLRLFVDKGNGNYECTTPEGFVAISNDKATKLIDRLEFSKLNFTIPKNWDS